MKQRGLLHVCTCMQYVIYYILPYNLADKKRLANKKPCIIRNIRLNTLRIIFTACITVFTKSLGENKIYSDSSSSLSSSLSSSESKYSISPVSESSMAPCYTASKSTSSSAKIYSGSPSATPRLQIAAFTRNLIFKWRLLLLIRNTYLIRKTRL